jgi:hypothetical protein
MANQKQEAMKHLIPTLFLLSLWTSVSGQCPAPTSESVLTAGDNSFTVKNDGTIWPLMSAPSPVKVLHSLWAGGLDVNGQVKLAAMRYGQTGNDFFAGPVNTVTALTDAVSCAAYDRIWELERWQVDEFLFRLGEPGYQIPEAILSWPAHGDQSMGHDYHIAPFFDSDGSGSYDPFQGDYPFYDYDPTPYAGYRQVELKGDRTLWWVMNDNGNLHTESGANPIGIEVRCMAYAFNSCGPLADVTFYEFEFINRGAFTIHETFIGLFADVDCGFPLNDLLQCDVQRGLAFTYDSPTVAGDRSAGGVLVLNGPFRDNDGLDNDGDGIADNETLPMSQFFYGEDPVGSADHYNTLRGHWGIDNSLCYGGNGHPDGGCNGVESHFMYPADTDPAGLGTGGVPQEPWTEQVGSANDKKFVVSAGPFTLLPGAVNDFHYAVVTAKATDGGDPIALLKQKSDLVRSVYDSAFLNMPCCPPNAAISYQFPGEQTLLYASIAEGTSYLWEFGDGTTSTERFPTHTYPSTSTYVICLTVTNACGTDTHCETLVMSTLGTSMEDAAEVELSIYPNPTSNGFHLRLEHGALQSVVLTDALGRVVRVQSASGQTVYIATDGLAPGLYVATLNTDGGVVHRRVVVE